MKPLVIISLIVALVVAPSAPPAWAQSNDRITVKKSDLPPDLLKKIEVESKIQTYGAWVGIGKEVGTAVNEGLSALTKNADDFAKTGVGKFTMVMIAWKVMGWHLVHVLGGTVFFIVGMLVFVWSFWLNCRTRRVRVNDKKEGEPKYQVVQPSDDAMGFHGVFFVVVTIFTLFIIFSA